MTTLKTGLSKPQITITYTYGKRSMRCLRPAAGDATPRYGYEDDKHRKNSGEVNIFLQIEPQYKFILITTSAIVILMFIIGYLAVERGKVYSLYRS